MYTSTARRYKCNISDWIVLVTGNIFEMCSFNEMCSFKKNEPVSSYALHAGTGTNYILISIFKYLLDFSPLQVKSYKQLQIYENEHFQLEYRSTSCICQVRYHGLSNACNL